MKSVRSAVSLAFVLALGLLALPSTVVSSSAAVPSAAQYDRPKFDPSVPPPGPGDLTWAQVSSMSQESTFSDSSPSPLRTESRVTTLATAGGVSCSIDTGVVYKRTSGSAYTYGTVGGKPRTTCTVLMVSIQQSTTLYKTVWWGLQKVAGPFNASNSGQGTLVQLNVQRICNSLATTTFRMEVRSTGVFPTGTTGTASAFETASLPCGTTP